MNATARSVWALLTASVVVAWLAWQHLRTARLEKVQQQLVERFYVSREVWVATKLEAYGRVSWGQRGQPFSLDFYPGTGDREVVISIGVGEEPVEPERRRALLGEIEQSEVEAKELLRKFTLERFGERWDVRVSRGAAWLEELGPRREEPRSDPQTL
jgi:hypothetical protein